jgi:hypothetical protein
MVSSRRCQSRRRPASVYRLSRVAVLSDSPSKLLERGARRQALDRAGFTLRLVMPCRADGLEAAVHPEDTILEDQLEAWFLKEPLHFQMCEHGALGARVGVVHAAHGDSIGDNQNGIGIRVDYRPAYTWKNPPR